MKLGDNNNKTADEIWAINSTDNDKKIKTEKKE